MKKISILFSLGVALILLPNLLKAAANETYRKGMTHARPTNYESKIEKIIDYQSSTVFLSQKLFSDRFAKKVDGGSRRKKKGVYRKKKGFMWGIFKGKSQCDCPKH